MSEEEKTERQQSTDNQPSKLILMENAIPETGEQPLNVLNENMDVHHHTHASHGKKNWKSYFWEFLMLFLAVFCGFLAEYQLEHKIERDKETIYAQNLLEDLKVDTAIYSEYARNNKFLFESIDTLILLLKKRERNQNIAKLAFTARMILPRYKALYTTDRTYEEMRGSGTLRLIRKKQVANSVSSYYYSVIDLKKYNDAAFIWATDFGKAMGKVFDAELLLKIVKEKKEQPAVSSDLLTEDRTVLNELATTAQYLYGAFLISEKIGNERSIAAQKLIELIKKEYQLK